MTETTTRWLKRGLNVVAAAIVVIGVYAGIFTMWMLGTGFNH